MFNHCLTNCKKVTSLTLVLRNMFFLWLSMCSFTVQINVRFHSMLLYTIVFNRSSSKCMLSFHVLISLTNMKMFDGISRQQVFKIVFSQRSAVALRVRVLRRGTQCFMVSNICVYGTILTCLMVRFWSEVTPSGAIFSGWITCSRTSIEMKSKHEKKAYISMNCD